MFFFISVPMPNSYTCLSCCPTAIHRIHLITILYDFILLFFFIRIVINNKLRVSDALWLKWTMTYPILTSQEWQKDLFSSLIHNGCRQVHNFSSKCTKTDSSVSHEWTITTVLIIWQPQFLKLHHYHLVTTLTLGTFSAVCWK